MFYSVLVFSFGMYYSVLVFSSHWQWNTGKYCFFIYFCIFYDSIDVCWCLTKHEFVIFTLWTLFRKLSFRVMLKSVSMPKGGSRKCLTIPKGLSENTTLDYPFDIFVSFRRRTENTMVKRNEIKRKTNDHQKHYS